MSEARAGRGRPWGAFGTARPGLGAPTSHAGRAQQLCRQQVLTMHEVVNEDILRSQLLPRIQVDLGDED